VNLRALVELTAMISAHSPNLIESGARLPIDPLQRYWSCSRAQGRLWLSRLTDFPAEVATAPAERRLFLWQRMQPLVADVFAGDLTARVWGAVLAARDCQSGEICAGPIARSVLLQHESVRRRVLQLMLESPGFSAEDFSRLDRLRRRLERWNDVFVGHLVRRYGLSEFAFDPERAYEFGDEQLADSWETGDFQVWDMYLVCLRSVLPEASLPGGRLADLRHEIARTMLAAFPREAFLEFGPLKSVRLRRLLSGNPRSEMHPPGLHEDRSRRRRM
jgi:hypothetical protein